MRLEPKVERNNRFDLRVIWCMRAEVILQIYKMKAGKKGKAVHF
jgi:hypothetical protein